MLFNSDRLNTRKQQTNYIAELYKDCALNLAKSKHERDWFVNHYKLLLNCQLYMKSITDRKISKNVNSHVKITRRNGCQDRFCPNCQRALAYRKKNMIEPILKWLLSKKTRTGKSYKYGLLFITPTIPNAKPTPKSVKKTQNYYKSCVNTFLNLPDLKGYGKNNNKGRILGSITKFEQTINHEFNSKYFDTINIHGHILAIVHGSYFHSRYYLKPEQWANLWHLACGTNDYQINVEATYFKDSKGHKHLHNRKAFNHIADEVVKYQTKSQDFINVNKRFYPKQNKIAKATLHPFYALVLGMKGQNHYLNKGLFRTLIFEYHHGSNKFDEFLNNDDKIIYKYKMLATYDKNKRKYGYKYGHFSDFEVAEYYCKGTLIYGYKNLLKKAKSKGTTLHQWVKKVHDYRRSKVAKSINNMMSSESRYNIKHKIILSYWKINVIKKYYHFMANYFSSMCLDLRNVPYYAAKAVINNVKNKSNIKYWLNNPSNLFIKKLYKKFHGIPKRAFSGLDYHMSGAKMNDTLLSIFFV